MTDEKNKIDPFDVAALEKSLNDSATRVSTIWVSFLLFALYLVTAAGTATHRQLFLGEPTKLPVLNIDLPLWWFFLLAPIFFVLLHAYVLMQVMLLGRTAAAYDQALQKSSLSANDDALVRQRLANTLFAQIFAGSARERTGPVGVLLKLMMWLTLAIAPVLLLLAFQFRFLPYHSNLVTWAHRGLIFLELATIFLLWPMVLDAAREMEWRQVIRQPVSLLTVLLFFIVSVGIATFPGEPMLNLLTGNAVTSVRCERWFGQYYDRFDLARVDAVDDEKLERIEKFSKAADLPPHQSERTHDLRGRDLSCSHLDFADLRRVDLTLARLQGASLKSARLEGASLDGVDLQGAILDRAELQRASLEDAAMQGASLESAELPGAILDGALLQGAKLDRAKLQGASLLFAQLQGASLVWSELQGAALDSAQLQGASFEDDENPVNAAEVRNMLKEILGAAFTGANLQGASLNGAQLQGAVLDGAQLQGAFLDGAQLQGASFDGADLSHAWLNGAYIWRAKAGACAKARIQNLKSDPVISDSDGTGIVATPDTVKAFIQRSTASIPEGPRKRDALRRMQAALESSETDMEEMAKTWRDCEKSNGMSQDQFDNDQAAALRDMICDDAGNLKVAIDRIIPNWTLQSVSRGPAFAKQLSGILGRDGPGCAVVKDLSEVTKKRLLGVLLGSEKAPYQQRRNQ